MKNKTNHSQILFVAIVTAALATVALDVFVWRSTGPAIEQGAQ